MKRTGCGLWIGLGIRIGGKGWVGRAGRLFLLLGSNYHSCASLMNPQENVSTMQTRDLMLECPVVQDCNPYGVIVPGREDGRAGMVSLNRVGRTLLSSLTPTFNRRPPSSSNPSTAVHEWTKPCWNSDFSPQKRCHPTRSLDSAGSSNLSKSRAP